MYKNYFYLNRLTHELNHLIQGSFLTSAFSQDKNILVLEFRKSAGNFYLLISVSQNDPYIQYRKEFHRAKRNVTDIFKGLLPQSALQTQIAINDRIIKIFLQSYDLLFYIHGKDTNVVLTGPSGIINSFKKIDDDFAVILNRSFTITSFIKEYLIPDLSDIPEDSNYIFSAKKKFPFLSKEILNETRLRIHTDDPAEFRDNLKDVINSIYFNKIAVFNDTSVNRMVFVPDTFKSFSGENKKYYDNYSDALNYFLISRFKNERSVNYKKLVSKYLEVQLDRVSNRLNEINGRISAPSKEEYYRNTGNLILSNLASIEKGMKNIELADFYNQDKNINIKLDDKLDAKKNADAYFEKARKEKQSRIYLSNLYIQLKDRYTNLLDTQKRFESITHDEDYLAIMADLKIKDDKQENSQSDNSSGFRHFLVEKKYHVYVGRDSRNNDLLTTKFAKQNDYWFHARSVSGSHVVLRVDNTKEVIPKSVLKKTAAIAAFFSKAKTSKLAPVAYTLKKYVAKRKGMDPGSVNLLKESVILVEPGIPDDCEYLNE